jgi:hypothetical protein
MTGTEHPSNPTPSDPPDPLIDEVRAIRQRVSERFGNDPRRLAEHLREVQNCSGLPIRRRRAASERGERLAG